MNDVAVVHVRTNLGLVEGVEQLGTVLLEQGLAERLAAVSVDTVDAPAYDPVRDHPSGLLNADGLVTVALTQADAVGAALDAGRFVVVLGGDDSTLFGNLLALRRRGRYGLVFLDAHYDFYPPDASPTGEASDSDLYRALGHGPDLIANLDGQRPLVRAGDVVVIGHRDPDEIAVTDGPLRATGALVIRLNDLRTRGVAAAAAATLERVASRDLDGLLVHIDADVLHDDLMPAVDYRIPDGLTRAEFIELVSTLLASGQAVGLDVTIYNPTLDPDRTVAATLADLLVDTIIIGRQ